MDMTRDEIKEKLCSICENLFKESGVDSDLYEYVDFIDDLGMDSIIFISLIVEIEDQLDMQVPDELLAMENFRNMEVTLGSIMSSVEAVERTNEEIEHG